MSEINQEFEMQAAAERRRLQDSLEELKQRLQENLDVQHNLRKHLLLISGIAAAAALTLGYGMAGIFQPGRVR